MSDATLRMTEKFFDPAYRQLVNQPAQNASGTLEGINQAPYLKRSSKFPNPVSATPPG